MSLMKDSDQLNLQPEPSGPGSSSYWLIVAGGEFAPEVFTAEFVEGERALVVFGCREGGEMYLHSWEGVDSGDWRLRQSEAGELLSVLWGLCAEVRYVMVDPLPRGLAEEDSAPSATIMDRQEFMESVMGRRPPEGVSGQSSQGHDARQEDGQGPGSYRQQKRQ